MKTTLIVWLCLSSGLAIGQKDKELRTFQQAIRNNMEFRNALHERDFFTRKVRRNVNVYVLPLNREMIDATLDYRQSTGDLKRPEKKKLQRESYDKYLRGESSAFVLLIHKFSASGRDFDLSFEDFGDMTRLSGETGDYPVTRYTKIFDEPLDLGWSKGYLYFPNFRDGQHQNSYSVRLAPLNKGTHTFAFDDSEVDFLALLEQGIPVEEYKNTWYPDDAAFGPDDLYKLAATIISIIGLM